MKVEIHVVTYLNPLFLEVIGLGLPTIDPMMAQDTADLTALLSLRSIDYRFPKFCKPGYAAELPVPLSADIGSAHFSYASACPIRRMPTMRPYLRVATAGLHYYDWVRLCGFTRNSRPRQGSRA